MSSAVSDYEVATLGQIFTPPAIVDCMRSLVRNTGRVLEPACGDGAFLKHFPGAMAIEIDPRPDRVTLNGGRCLLVARGIFSAEILSTRLAEDLRKRGFEVGMGLSEAVLEEELCQLLSNR